MLPTAGLALVRVTVSIETGVATGPVSALGRNGITVAATAAAGRAAPDVPVIAGADAGSGTVVLTGRAANPSPAVRAAPVRRGGAICDAVCGANCGAICGAICGAAPFKAAPFSAGCGCMWPGAAMTGSVMIGRGGADCAGFGRATLGLNTGGSVRLLNTGSARLSAGASV